MNFVPMQKPEYLETNPNQATNQAPEKARFESDKNTQAASELPVAGKTPLPTLDGKESQGLQFENREYSPGKHSGGSPPSMASNASQSQPEKQEKEASKSPTPMPTPKTDLAILKPQPPTPEQPKDSQQPSHPQKSSTPSQPRPPSPAERPGYQSQTRVVRIEGNISNRGPAATDVVATPLGRYKKLLSDAVGSRWYYLVQQDMDLYRLGTVVIRFRVTQSGTVDAVKVMSNTSNEFLAATSIQSIKDAEMPPIPSDIAASLDRGRIEVDYTFSIISN